MVKNLTAIFITCLCVQLALAQSFQQQCLDAHNKYRAMHGVPNLVLDSALTEFAQEWANHLASTGTFGHRPNNKYGENTWAQWGSTSVTGGQAVKSWYDEIKDYDYSKPGFSMKTGHFTQVVWKNSKKLGCAIATKGTNVYVVANYDPKGNFIDQFEDNVFRPRDPNDNVLVLLPQNALAQSFQQQCLDAHNKYRAMHGVPNLVLDSPLTEFAQEWADHLASTGSFVPRPNNNFGQNIYRYFGSPDVTGRQVVKAWYDGIKDYNYNQPGFSTKSGQFTQLVWKNSKKLGCAIATKDSDAYVVANYDPPGNYLGQFEDNVLRARDLNDNFLLDYNPPDNNKGLLPQNALAQSFQQQCLDAHNKYRAMHGVPNLVLDSPLTEFAQEWADHLASTGTFGHRPNNKYGENIWAQWGSTSVTGGQAVKSWYDEIKDYDYSKPGFSMKTGHFTQVVWKNSKKLGCAIATKGTNAYVVANYDPKGNFIDQFEDNVFRPSAQRSSLKQTIENIFGKK